MLTDLLLISVGNTRTRMARVHGLEAGTDALEPARVVGNDDGPGLVGTLQELLGQIPARTGGVLIASVNEPVAERLSEAVSAWHGAPRVFRVSTDSNGLKIPVQHTLTPPISVGADRLLAALGAFTRSGEACVVIDAGTAVTVDYIDGFGVFQGGVIAPGLGMQLRALHQHTSALPSVLAPRGQGETLPDGPWGKTTPQAMLLGCAASVRGLARLLIDQYAEKSGSYPRVIATGGDAPLLFQNDELVEHIVPDLVLIGMLATWRSHHPAGEAVE